MAFKDQINQNVGFFIYNREFLFFSGIIGSPQAFNRFQIIPGAGPHKLKKREFLYVPKPKYTDFHQKYPRTASGIDFLHFCVKLSIRI